MLAFAERSLKKVSFFQAEDADGAKGTADDAAELISDSLGFSFPHGVRFASFS